MTALAMKQPGLKPAAKIVLYWIADHHNESTGDCFPSINRLAEICEMSRRSVENHIADLEVLGLIKRQERRREGGGKTANSYILRLGQTDAQNLRMPPAKSAHGDAQNLRMNNLVRNNPGNEQEHAHRVAASECADPAQGELIPFEADGENLPPANAKMPKYAGGLYDGCRTIDEEFERVWSKHPRKVGKGAARKAWAKARAKTDFMAIAAPLAIWIKLQKGSDPKFIPHFATWLNEERWGDDQTHARNRAETTSDRLDRLGAAPAGASGDEIAGPTRTPPEIELRID